MLRCENKGYVNVCGVLNRYSIMYTCIHFNHTSFELVFLTILSLQWIMFSLTKFCVVVKQFHNGAFDNQYQAVYYFAVVSYFNLFLNTSALVKIFARNFYFLGTEFTLIYFILPDTEVAVYRYIVLCYIIILVRK